MNFALDNNIEFIHVEEGVLLAHASTADFLTIATMQGLSQIEMSILAKRKVTKIKNEFLVSRWLCKQMACITFGGKPSDWQIINQPNGAPKLKNMDGDEHGSISISHCDDKIAVIVSTTDRPIGVDIEPHFERENPRELLETICHVNELAWYDATPSLRRFYQLWTAKEAITKASQTSLWEAHMRCFEPVWLSQNELTITHFHNKEHSHLGAFAIGEN